MNILPQAFIAECFSYVEGVLRWKSRPASHFASATQQAAFNGRWDGVVAGSTDRFGYTKVAITSAGKQRMYKRHRLIWAMHFNTWPEQLDHINRDPSDDRVDNLRPALPWQNSANTRGRSISKLPKGVQKHGPSFRATIMHRGMLYRLGTFRTINEAKASYIEKAMALHGTFFRAEE